LAGALPWVGARRLAAAVSTRSAMPKTAVKPPAKENAKELKRKAERLKLIEERMKRLRQK
jgi:hypothetical protein